MGVGGALGVHNFLDATRKTAITANITANIHPYFSRKVFFFSSAIYFNENVFLFKLLRNHKKCPKIKISADVCERAYNSYKCKDQQNISHCRSFVFFFSHLL